MVMQTVQETWGVIILHWLLLDGLELWRGSVQIWTVTVIWGKTVFTFTISEYIWIVKKSGIIIPTIAEILGPWHPILVSIFLLEWPTSPHPVTLLIYYSIHRCDNLYWLHQIIIINQVAVSLLYMSDLISLLCYM